MNFRLVFKVTGKTLLLEAAAMVLPMLVGLFYGESPRPFLFAILITAAVGVLLTLPKASSKLFAREGFFTVGLIWVLFGAFGALPFYFCGYFNSYVDCLFECISGFSTTGATILSEIEGLPMGILFWRSFTHWLGGMGVLVLTIALLPSLGSRSAFLMQAESPGPVKSKLVPKTSQSSKILYGIYLSLTLIQIICLKFAGMNLYDAVVHAFATAGTGGFSNRNLSIAAYDSPAIEIIITIFMLLFALNFAIYFLILCGKWKRALKSDELRFFLIIVALSGLVIAVNTNASYSGTFGAALRHAFFQVASIISTTGFASTDFNLWPELSRSILVLLMFIGACASSTGGGLKCARVLLLLKNLWREIQELIHPRSVHVVKLDGQVVEERVLHTVHVFFSAYLLILASGVLLISLDNFSFTTTVTAVISCLGNIGPGLELVGPMGNFSIFSNLSKLVLSLCMIIGRLEIFPILILFSQNAWKRS